jgi:hypothetical protein
MTAEGINIDKENVRYQNYPTESTTFLPQNTYQHSNTLCTQQIMPCVTSFPKIEKFTQMNPFSVKQRHPYKKSRVTYFTK